MKKWSLIALGFGVSIFTACNWLLPPKPDDPQTEVAQFKSGDSGSFSTETGEGIQFISGTIPGNAQGQEASVTFGIETNLTDPGRLGDGASFKSGITRFTPEYFHFTWPLQLSLPYDENEDPNTLSVMHFDYGSKSWIRIPKTGMDQQKKLIYFNTLTLGVFALAELSDNYRSFDWADGGFRFRDPSRNYYYSLTVASVSNPRFPWQQSWLVGPGYVAGSTGATINEPLADTWAYLVQADYQMWISRTKPGTYWSPPVIETYSVPSPGTLNEANTCPLSATTFPDLNLCSPWVDLVLQPGGTWIQGRPTGWAAPTTTYGTGDFQATLNWINNESHVTDLDLHLYGPNDMHIYWWNTESSDGSIKLDRDWTDELGNATENIFSLKEIPSGNYKLAVRLFGGAAVSFNVRIILDGSVETYTGTLSAGGEEVTVYEFTK